MKKLLQGEALYKRAIEIGIPTKTKYGYATSQVKVEEAELQRQVREYYRAKRESRLWIVAVVSAAASVLSAAAAIIAVVTAGG